MRINLRVRARTSLHYQPIINCTSRYNLDHRTMLGMPSSCYQIHSFNVSSQLSVAINLWQFSKLNVVQLMLNYHFLLDFWTRNVEL